MSGRVSQMEQEKKATGRKVGSDSSGGEQGGKELRWRGFSRVRKGVKG